MSRFTILAEVANERRNQHKKWGVQDLPIEDITQIDGDRKSAEIYKRINDMRLSVGIPIFRDILMEEVYEAVSETAPERQREELVQVAAVAVQMIECIDRKTRKPGMIRRLYEAVAGAWYGPEVTRRYED